MTPENERTITERVTAEWNRRQAKVDSDMALIEEQIGELELESELTLKRLKYLETETAIKFMEGDVLKIDKRIKQLKSDQAKKSGTSRINIGVVLGRVMYYLEHLDQILQKQIDPINKAQFFGAIFYEILRYSDLQSGTKNPRYLTGVSELFQLASGQIPGMVAPPRLELGTQGSSSPCSTN